MVSVIESRANFYNRNKAHLVNDVIPEDFNLAWSICCGDLDQQEVCSLPLPSLPVKDPYPCVNWASINPHTPKSLPKPDSFPVLGPPTKECYDKILANYLNINRMKCQEYEVWYGISYPDGVKHQDFQLGWKPGFNTSQGIVQPPDYPVRGYLYVNGSGWVLHADFG